MTTTLPPVLVVDDDPTCLRLFTRFLESTYAVAPASDGHAALAQCDGKCYAAVVSDFDMPGMDGLCLLAEVHRRMPSSALVLLSGHPHAAEQAAIRGVPLDAFVAKPVKMGALLDILAQTISEHVTAR